MKDVEYGRTRRGSLIQREGDEYYLEITNPEDIEIVNRLGVPFSMETQTKYSLRDKGYVEAIVVRFTSPRRSLGLGKVK